MQIGLSPKLYSALIAIVVGIVLILLGERDTGLAILLTGIGALGLGYAAPVGEVAVEQGPASDDLLEMPIEVAQERPAD